MTKSIVDIVSLRYKRDKRQAVGEVRSFITDKITQRYLWYLLLAVRCSLQKKMLPPSEVQEIVIFLSEKFSITPSAVGYVREFTLSNEVGTRKRNFLVSLPGDIKPAKKERAGLRKVTKYWFHLNMLKKIKTLTDTELLEYRDALGIVVSALRYYPETKHYR